MGTPRVQSVDRAFALLVRLAEPGGGRSLAALAAETGLTVATAHRLLATLEANGAVFRGGVAGYRIGLQVHALARGASPDELLIAAVQPVLRRLARSCGLTVQMGVMSADLMVTYLAKHQPPRALPVQTRVGSQLEAYCTGLGKVLLAALPGEVRRLYLAESPFVPLTAKTIVDPERLAVEIFTVARQGFAIDDCEIHETLRCVAVPVHGADGDTIAALSCSGHVDTVDQAAIPGLVVQLQAAAVEVRRKLFPAAG